MIFELFGTHFRENPDYSYEDALNEANLLFARQKLIQDFADGKASLDDLLSLLESQDMSPDDYVEAVNQNLIVVGW